MEHPLISGLDQLSEEQISERIHDLNRKLSIAARMGNGHLCNQVRMAIESYQSRLRYMQDQRNQNGNSNPHFDKIDIS
jgi:peptide subunit release factor 1 (eRF1)